MAKAKTASSFYTALALAALVLVVYFQAVQFDFVTYDDPDYSTANPHVQAGFTLANIVWAFTSSYAGNWFPLTWLSHTLDWRLFGADAGLHHLVNFCLHAATTVLLFLLLKRMTGAHWRSALVAFLFGLHPLHVESVAWVAERKDVLSALFWVLTLWAYILHAAHATRSRYALMLAFFAAGLMSKPMVVTLPLVLILLDRWPLKRGNKLLEKIPFFALSLVACTITYVVHEHAGAAVTFEQIPVAVRIQNALVSYVVYVSKTFWPVHLGVFYPYPLNSMLIPAIICAVALTVMTAAALRLYSRFPYIATGWLWYLIVLLPVIGLIQVGAQSRADRYMYLPSIGLFIAIVWGGAQALERFPQIRIAAPAAVCLGCAALTWIQVGYWRDSIALYQHAVRVAPDSYVARVNLASVFDARGDRPEAIAQLRAAVQKRPGFALAHAELGQLLAEDNQPQQGLQELQEAVRLKPDLADAHYRLGSVLGSLGRNSDAAAEFSKVIELQPNNVDGYYNLGLALAQAGNLEAAEKEFSKAVQLAPEDANAHFSLGIALARLGRIKEAAAQVEEAVRLKPDFPEAQQALTQLRNGQQ